MEPSERQKIKDKNNVIRISSFMLANKNKYVILDTETTGLGNRDVIIQIGLIDLNGNTVFESLIRPSKRKTMSTEASNIHDYKMSDLQDAPILKEVWPKISKAIGNKRLLIYNSNFDIRLIEQTAKQDGFDLRHIDTRCIMLMYAEYLGDWNDYYGNYRWPKLYGGDHSAIGDCKATLKAIEGMASTDMKVIPKQWWEFWK